MCQAWMPEVVGSTTMCAHCCTRLAFEVPRCQCPGIGMVRHPLAMEVFWAMKVVQTVFKISMSDWTSLFGSSIWLSHSLKMQKCFAQTYLGLNFKLGPKVAQKLRPSSGGNSAVEAPCGWRTAVKIRSLPVIEGDLVMQDGCLLFVGGCVP